MDDQKSFTQNNEFYKSKGSRLLEQRLNTSFLRFTESKLLGITQWRLQRTKEEYTKNSKLKHNRIPNFVFTNPKPHLINPVPKNYRQLYVHQAQFVIEPQINNRLDASNWYIQWPLLPSPPLLPP